MYSGKPLTITWTSTGVIDKVYIHCYTSAGALNNDGFISGFSSDPNQGKVANTGSFTWTPKATMAVGGYILRVQDAGGSKVKGEAQFSITAEPLSITVTQPTAGKCEFE